MNNCIFPKFQSNKSCQHSHLRWMMVVRNSLNFSIISSILLHYFMIHFIKLDICIHPHWTKRFAQKTSLLKLIPRTYHLA